MDFYVRELTSWIDPADVFLTLYATDENAFWLDGAANPNSHFSVMGHSKPGSQVDTQTMYRLLEQDVFGLASSSHQHGNLPFGWRPGFVGWFNYRANPIAVTNTETGGDSAPAGSWLPVSEALVLDHANRRIWFAGSFETEANFGDWVNGALIRLGLAGGASARHLRSHAQKQPTVLARMAHTPVAYLGLVEQAKRHIAAGDVYQLCLTNRLDFEHGLDPLEVFLRLRAASPSPYSAFIKIGNTALVSSSPEQFFGISNGTIRTKPIKGTRPRSADAATDADYAQELQSNVKERAENLMIVDLMRNDLTRIGKPESVIVEKLFDVESYSKVHQLVSTVSASLNAGVTLAEVADALLPGGSMTGAPKPRACQLIEELEGVERGVYSGANGWITSSSEGLSLNLAMTIRSLVFNLETNQVSLGVGGGITIDSNPQAEVNETELKALALLEVIGAANPWQQARVGNLDSAETPNF